MRYHPRIETISTESPEPSKASPQSATSIGLPLLSERRVFPDDSSAAAALRMAVTSTRYR